MNAFLSRYKEYTYEYVGIDDVGLEFTYEDVGIDNVGLDGRPTLETRDALTRMLAQTMLA